METSVETPKLRRSFGLFSATMLGTGAIIGAGIFVLSGIAAGEAGPALLLAFTLNGLAALTIGACYAELASAMPRAGGSYYWIKQGIGSCARNVLVQALLLQRLSAVVRPLLLVLAVTFSCSAKAEDEHLGLIEYELACMPCHGVDGRGDGPAAKRLNARPSDLTQIAKTNGGRFPFKQITEIVDGRQLVAAHGARVMPVWGDRYRVHAEPGETTAIIERHAQARINALVRYLAAIQKQ